MKPGFDPNAWFYSKKECRPSQEEETAYLGRSCMGSTHCMMDKKIDQLVSFCPFSS